MARDISNWPEKDKERFRRNRDNPYRRKADQHWEMGSLARQDGDKADMESHYAKAREYDRQAAEYDGA